MRVTVDRLEQKLSGPSSQIYLVSGDEPLLVQESADLIRSSLRGQGFTEREVHEVDQKFDWQEVLFSANSMSLFADRKIIELHLQSAKPGVQGATGITAYLQQADADTALLMVMPKLDKSGLQSAWCKAVDAAGLIVQIWPVDAGDLPGWLIARARRHGLKLDSDVSRILAERVEGNLLAADQELQYLALISQSGEIGIDSYVTEVQSSARYTTFALIDAAIEGKPIRLRQILHGLKTEGVHPLQILALTSRELKTLIGIRREVERGVPIARAMSATWMPPHRKPLVHSVIKRVTVNGLEDLLAKACEVDQLNKGVGEGDPWVEMEDLLLCLAGLKTGTHRLSVPDF